MHTEITRRFFFNSALLVLFVFAGAFVMIKQQGKGSDSKIAQDANGFAVVELFTSEGCSSCPPADDFIADLQKTYGKKELYILSYHVDYWDRQGWKDHFSDKAYSERQQQYATWLNLQSVYTPQAVVNGKTEYVGSHRQAITEDVLSNMQQSLPRSLQLKCSVTKDKIEVKYKATSEKNTELILALVQKNGDSNVKSGENAGRHLAHVQIVRSFVKANPNQPGISIPVPAGFTSTGWEIIGLIQNKVTGVITDAAKSNFVPGN